MLRNYRFVQIACGWCGGVSNRLCSWKSLYAAWAIRLNTFSICTQNSLIAFRRLIAWIFATNETRTKIQIWTPRAPNFGAFDGKVKTLIANISTVRGFSGPKFTFSKGYHRALPKFQTWSSWGLNFGPQNFLTQNFFFDYGSTSKGESPHSYTLATPFRRRRGQIRSALLAFGLQRDPPVNGGATAPQIWVKFGKT